MLKFIKSLGKARCPYCNEVLDPKPKRAKKCPHCKNKIRTLRGELYTEKQIEEYNKQRDRSNTIKRLENMAGVTESTYIKHEKALEKRFGFPPAKNDVVWSILNTLTDGKHAEFAYSEMASIARSEGKEANVYIEQSMKAKRKSIRREVFSTKKNCEQIDSEMEVRVDTKNDEIVCDACRKNAEHTYEFDEFLQKMPIPDDCTNPEGCRCWVRFQFKDLS